MLVKHGSVDHLTGHIVAVVIFFIYSVQFMNCHVCFKPVWL